MKKLLRYSLTLVFALVASVGFAQTTFDFDNDYKTLFPGLPGVSSMESNEGDFNEATTCTVDGIAVTVSAKEEGIYQRQQNLDQLCTFENVLRNSHHTGSRRKADYQD